MTYGKSSQAGYVFRAIAGAYPAAVFVIVPIDNIVAAVFNTPVATVGGKNTLGVGLLRGSTGDAIGNIASRCLPVFFVGELAFNDKCLPDMRKVKIAVELSRSPDFTDFNPAVVGRIAK